ncbi:MAG TPA: hypothetical protein VFB32_15660 [Rudaea sp.]|nr:hypothetical protein [Rudaea sp.]
MKIWVFVLEIPSDIDLFEERTEGFALVRTLRVAQIGAKVRVVSSNETLARGLQEYLALAKTVAQGELLPVLHISAHGNEKGIALTDGSLVSWSELANLLAPINRELDGNLDVVFSSCKGFHAITMAMAHEQTDPRAFNVLLGPDFEPTWGEALVGYAAFYYQLIRTKNLDTAWNALRAASGQQGWHVLSAQTARTLFEEELATRGERERY